MRFNMFPSGQPNPAANGLYVRHEDYARLEQECERLRKQVNMLVKQHMPLEPIDGLDGWSEVISATKAIELRDAALNLLAKCQEKLDPHRDAVLWGEVCDAFKVKP